MTTPENLPLRAEPSVQVMDLTAGDPLIGMVLSGRYRLEEKLGRGTTGAVYLASHVNFSRKFAIKVLHAARADDAKLVRRFDREAELGGLVSHANVISVIDVGETPDGTRYMVMELATGENLAVLLQDEAPMAAPRVLHLLRELCEGLHHAHERRVIHRDFKPENIIVERDDHGLELPRIVDFGIAIARDEAEEPDSPDRLTTHGLVLGTPHYMAPEQATGFAMDHRIDLFALGVIAFEMLSGVLPFDGSGVEVARANILVPTPRIAERVPGLAVDPLLEAFTRLLMAKDPTARPVGANAARELLDLIERDPLAAAAALGVPADAVVLPPIVAVAPADRAAAPPMAFLPSPTAPFFTRSAPPSVEVLAVPDEGVRLRAAPPRRRWVLALAGVAALAALGVVLWMATRPPRPPLAPVAAPVAMAMTPTPTPTPIDATVAVEVVEPPGPTPLPPPLVGSPGHPDAPPPIARGVVAPPVVAPGLPPHAPPVPPPAAPADPTAKDVASLYADVGRELQRAAAAREPGDTQALAIRFRRIRLADAMATPDARRDAFAALASIRRGIADLAKPR